MTTSGQNNRHGRGRNGKFIRTIDTAERDAQACRMRAQGHSYVEIAEQLGFDGRATAYRAVERAIMAVISEPAVQVRTLELARLDAMLVEVWRVLKAKHVVVSQGRVVLHPDTGEPLLDDGPVLAAVDRALKISERRARLLGLDAPVKVQAITVDEVEAELERWEAQVFEGQPPRALGA